jgi:hypothetical protein
MIPRWHSPYLGGVRSTRAEADYYDGPDDEPDPDPDAHRWPRREAAIKRLTRWRERRAATQEATHELA